MRKKVWIRQLHNKILEHSYRFGEVCIDKETERATIVCLETGNVLIDCSEKFYNDQVKNGMIIEVDRAN